MKPKSEEELKLIEEEKMSKQKERSRSASKVDTSDWTYVQDNQEASLFVGYDQMKTETSIQRYRTVKAKGKDQYQLVLSETPFYAESGGQVGDTGVLHIGNEQIKVLNSFKENSLQVLEVNKLPADFQAVTKAEVDLNSRQATANNHSATHLLHAALREVLGKHVEQKGSLVNPDYLRFDFSHFSKMTEEELEKVEQLANEKIRAAIPLDERRNVAIEDAKKLGAMALFGEKYGEFVRVITFDPTYSVELCGGTHVKNTAEINLVKIISESSIATGVRRIEAITGNKAWSFMQDQLKQLQHVRESLKNPKDIVLSVNKLLEETNFLRKTNDNLEQIQAELWVDRLETELTTTMNLKFLARTVEVSSAEVLRRIGQLIRREKSSFVVLGAEIEGKVQLVVALGDDAVATTGLNASQLIRELAKEIQGGGGGQPFLATAGGQNPAGLPTVYQKAAQLIEKK
jgi:alanyl-tRNA synthetase